MSQGRYEPHRGVLILVLGILSLFFFGIILGPIAWILGNSDLKKIRAGVMDPEGEQMTNVGRILGMVGTILNIVVCCALAIFYSVIIAIAVGTIQEELEKSAPPNGPANAPRVRPDDEGKFKFPLEKE
ncbi:MAG: DUF4190 domain-containing protein [Gemmatales bacterium]|nr:DUF4190 domain-containing protein [Gemmatales bacterium]MDW8388258.1 DUF4190 domain-containing protein [Gemmatales bacterium]